MIRGSSCILFLVVFLVALDFSRPAFAYLDPGTGSMILQLLLGGIAGAAIVLKIYWESLTNVFRRRGGKKSKTRSSGVDR